MIKIFSLAIFLTLCSVVPVVAAFEYKHNIKVNSNHLEIDEVNNESIFTGKVILTTTDITLKTELIKISYRINKEGKRELNTIDIPTKVEVIRLKNDEIIIANKAYYEADLMRLTLMGDVLLKRDNDILRTNELLLYFKL